VETRDQKIVSEPTYFAKGKKQSGFTIIELMMVIAIVSILATIALSAYSNFMMRSKVAEGLGFASEAKTAVTSYYSGNNSMPIDNNAAGLSAPASYDRFDYLSSLEINELGTDPSNGIITITLKIPGLGIQNKLELVPTTINGLLVWECRPEPSARGVASVRVPPNCRG
jgi:type IV pilus assembly protein PilA